jgi:hypothetical protein
LRKLNVPPLLVKQLVRTVVRKEAAEQDLNLVTPNGLSKQAIQMTTLTLGDQQAMKSVLQQTKDTLEVATICRTIDTYTATLELAAVYRLDFWKLLDQLRNVYDGADEIPVAHLSNLREQIEEQTCKYEIREETRDVALALVKPNGFVKTIDSYDNAVYTAEISYPISKEDLIKPYEYWKEIAGEFGFHYDPYNFDSKPEASFLERILNHLRTGGDEVEDIYFMGGFTDVRKTDFRVEYKDEEGKWRDYTPDFVIRCKSGKCLIVEIKDARFEASTNEDLGRDQRGELPITREGRKAVALRKWTELDPTKLKYELIFARDDLDYDQLRQTREFIKEC